MFLNSILALTDFSVDGDKALARAGQIARGHGLPRSVERFDPMAFHGKRRSA